MWLTHRVTESDRTSTLASWFLCKMLILVLLLSVVFIEKSFLLEGQLTEKLFHLRHPSGEKAIHCTAPEGEMASGRGWFCLPCLSKILAALLQNILGMLVILPTKLINEFPA